MRIRFTAHLRLTDKMESLDFGGSRNGEFVLGWNRKSPVSVSELAQNVHLRHVVPYRLHKLKMRRLHTLRVQILIVSGYTQRHTT